jgi:LuxR family maltose regulon positive regulatory protein
MTHTLAAEDWEGAERLMQLAASQAIADGQVVKLSRWLEAFPDTRVREDAQLAAFQGWALFMMGQIGPAATYADLAQELLPTDAEPTTRAMVICLRAYTAQFRFDLPVVIELAREALELLDESDPSGLHGAALGSMAQAQILMGDLPAATQTLRSLARQGLQAGHPLSVVTALADLGWLLHLQGQTREAVALCKQALDQCLDARGNALPLAGRPHFYLARIYYDANELDRAHQHLVKAVQLGEQLGPAEGLGSVIALAQLQQAMGEPEAALATIGEIRQAVAQLHVPQADALVAGAQAEIQLRQGNLVAVEAWAAAAGLSPTDSPDHLREPAYMTYARLLLEQNRAAEAHTLLANCERFARNGGRHRSLIEVRILQALLQQRLGRQPHALDCLAEAVRLAAPGTYCRLFLDQGQPVLDLLPGVRPVEPAFVDSLLTASEPPPSSPRPHTRADANRALIEPLSERELEVLGLVVDGLTNREISEKLFISVGTVKTHTHHIYGKLGVSSRPRAIARARELDLT